MEALKKALRESTRVRASWELRVEQSAAFGYFARISAELESRGLITVDSEIESWAQGLREGLRGASRDLVAGLKTIEEWDDDSLRLLGLVAVTRELYAAYLVLMLSGADASAE